MKVLVSETLHEENGEQVHTLVIKAAPPEIVMVDGIACYQGRDGHLYVADGPARGTLPNSYMYWLALERWDKLPGRPRCETCDRHHKEPYWQCPNI